MRRKYFFKQNDIKINDFDEGVLILEPFFWGNVIFKMCFFCNKSHHWGKEIFFSSFPRIVTLQSYVLNASLYSRCLRFSKQEQTLYPGSVFAIPKPFSTLFFWGDLGREQYQSLYYGVNSDGINRSVHCVHYILEQKKSHENSTSRDSNPRHLSYDEVHESDA